MSRHGPPLLDLHDLGQRQTGNETWARGIGRALFELEGPGAYDIAVTPGVAPRDLAALPARRTVQVSGRSSKRLAWDLPGALRAGDNSVVLVQYTAPVTTVPVVVVVHDLSFEDELAPQWLPLATRLRYRATIRASVRRAAHVLTVSEFTKRDLVQRYGVPEDQVSVAPNAVDPDFAALLDAEPERRDGPPTVLCVGNVLPRKNLLVVAHAVRTLRDRGSDVRLRVVGSVAPTGRRDAATMAGLLGDAVTFTGYVDRARLAREYLSAHVLAFPSLFEGFGIPAVEALAAGLPVVVSDRGALPEVVGRAGVVVPRGDPAAWADALSEGMQTDVAARLRVSGRARERDFTWTQAAVAISQALASVSAIG